VIHTLANPGATTKPAVDAARQFLGPMGVSLVAAGTLISVYGYLSANMLHNAASDVCDGRAWRFPCLFCDHSSAVRTPHISILAFALLLLIFSISGDFRWNATLSAVARLFMYGAVAAALPALRRKKPGGAAFSIAWRNSVCGDGPRLHGFAAHDRAMARGPGRARHFWNCGSELVLGAAKCCWKLRRIVTISRLVRLTDVDLQKKRKPFMMRTGLRDGVLATGMLLCCCAKNVCGQEAAKHAIAFEDMIQMHRVADPKISPDGKWVAFAVATPDMNANRNASNIWIVSDGGRRGRAAYAERKRYFASMVA